VKEDCAESGLNHRVMDATASPSKGKSQKTAHVGKIGNFAGKVNFGLPLPKADE
jgi:hypothetical protein